MCIRLHDRRAIAIWQVSAEDYSRLVFELLFVGMVAYFITNELREGFKGGLREYLNGGFWNVVDIAALVFYILNIGAYVWIVDFMRSLQLKENNLAEACCTLCDPEGCDATYNEIVKQFGQISSLTYYYENYALTNTVSLFIGTVRFFKYVEFHQRMALVTNTIVMAATELIHFLFLYIIVSLMYACMVSIVSLMYACIMSSSGRLRPSIP